jgi:ParB-like chromosome segregation protein Spo0J
MPTIDAPRRLRGEKTSRRASLQFARRLYRNTFLPFGDINVLLQTRKTFDQDALVSLKEDIADKGLMKPLVVARFSRAACERYVARTNLLWNGSVEVDNLSYRVEKGSRIYYVLLAGERRFRASRLLWEEGCFPCRSATLPCERGECYRRHLTDDVVEVRLRDEIDADDALFLQLSENTHVPVPPEEEAEAYALMLRALRQNGSYPLARFARRVGRSVSKIEHALRYHLLPATIKVAVMEKRISYGMAVELARLYPAVEAVPASEAVDLAREAAAQEAQVKKPIRPSREEIAIELAHWVRTIETKKLSSQEVRRMVQQRLREPKDGMLFGADELGNAGDRPRALRRAAGVKMVRDVWGAVHYLNTITSMAKTGAFGNDSPYSLNSAGRVFRSLVEALEQALPVVRGHLPKAAVAKAEEVLPAFRQAIGALHPVLDDGGEEE